MNRLEGNTLLSDFSEDIRLLGGSETVKSLVVLEVETAVVGKFTSIGELIDVEVNLRNSEPRELIRATGSVRERETKLDSVLTVRNSTRVTITGSEVPRNTTEIGPRRTGTRQEHDGGEVKSTRHILSNTDIVTSKVGNNLESRLLVDGVDDSVLEIHEVIADELLNLSFKGVREHVGSNGEHLFLLLDMRGDHDRVEKSPSVERSTHTVVGMGISQLTESVSHISLESKLVVVFGGSETRKLRHDVDVVESKRGGRGATGHIKEGIKRKSLLHRVESCLFVQFVRRDRVQTLDSVIDGINHSLGEGT